MRNRYSKMELLLFQALKNNKRATIDELIAQCYTYEQPIYVVDSMRIALKRLARKLDRYEEEGMCLRTSREDGSKRVFWIEKKDENHENT